MNLWVFCATLGLSVAQLSSQSPCPPGQIYKSCGTHCPPTCDDRLPMCILSCKSGCFCDASKPYLRNHTSNECVTASQCNADPQTKCYNGQVFQTCGTACPPTCDDRVPICTEQCVEGCFCPRTAPYLHNGTCVSPAHCPNKTQDSCSGYCDNGLCWKQDNTPNCDCYAGWSGLTCNIKSVNDSCQQQGAVCANGGECLHSGNSTFCRCIHGYSGDKCDIPPPCMANNPCKNGATCVAHFGSAVCMCGKGWGGQHCTVPTADLCHPNPCTTKDAHARCYVKFGEPVCDCSSQSGYSGSKCTVHNTPTHTCKTAEVVNCVMEKKPNVNTQCGQAKLYAQCAIEKGCFDLLEVWCNGFLKSLCPTFHSAQCHHSSNVCNTTIWQQCLISIDATKFSDQCGYQHAYVGCADDAGCPDFLAHFCEGVNPSCHISACQNQTKTNGAANSPVSLLGMSPYHISSVLGGNLHFP